MRTVLVVDDDVLLRRSVARLLGAHGVQVLAAADGQEALHTLAAHRVDAVVMDVDMPGLDGLTALGRIRADPALASLRVVLMSAGCDAPTARDAGAHGFLAKPFSDDELQRALWE